MKFFSSKIFAVVVFLAVISMFFAACNKENAGGAGNESSEGGTTPPTPFVPTEPVPEAVDFGLPSGTLWASFNLGASKVGERGKYYAWGETKAKEKYSWENYLFTQSGSTAEDVRLSKYVTEAERGEPDDKKVLEPADDAASVCLGGAWQLPTKEQFAELMQNSKMQLVTVDEVKGLKFTSKIPEYTDKEIIFFFEGNFDGESIENDNDGAYLWINALSSASSRSEMVIMTTSFAYASGFRYIGNSIRPVYFVPLESISLEESSVKLGETLQLSVSKTPENASCRSFTWTSSDENVAVVEQDGKVMGASIGKVTITATDSEDSKIYATCTVNVVPDVPVPDAVSLGLPSGTKWASFNLGASQPYYAGDYYAWGELDAKNDFTGWSSYYYYISGSVSANVILSKYVFDDPDPQLHGEVDDKMKLDASDDAATFHLGSDWHIPTLDQVKELWTNCNSKEEVLNGVTGLRFTSKVSGFENASIFIPYAGYMNAKTLENLGVIYCWSSSLATVSTHAYYLTNTATPDKSWTRYSGLTIRPVYLKE